jgi:AcrR family transcriptional regulator
VSAPAAGSRRAADKPNCGHAFELALTLFLRGERVDMQTLSATLGVGRTTLYRWVGDRERLIGEVLARLTDQGWELAEQQVPADGADRAADVGRRFMEISAGFTPVRTFAEREPQLALRVLLARDGVVARRIRAGFQRALERELPVGTELDMELVDISVQAGTALQWAPIIIGGEPEIERAALLIRSMFETHMAGAA